MPKEAEIIEQPKTSPRVDIQKLDQQSLEFKLMEQYGKSDQTLNEHVYGNIKLKLVNFNSPAVYNLFEIKVPDTKQ